MFLLVLSHLLLTILIWLLATKILKKSQPPSKKPLKIHREFSLAILKDSDESKRRKNKRKVKKQRKNQTNETFDIVSNKLIVVDQKEDEESDRDEDIGEKELRKSKHKVVEIENDSKFKERPVFQAQKIQQGVQINIEKEIALEEQPLKYGLSRVYSRIAAQSQKQYNKNLVIEELQLIRNYFLNDLEQMAPYNGRSGQYKLTLQGTVKSIYLEWVYHGRYPSEIVQVKYSKEGLNLLELQKIANLLNEHKEQARKQENYFYLFNLTTSIFQDCLIAINDFAQQDNKTVSKDIQDHQLSVLRQGPNGQVDLSNPKNMLAMKEFHDQIFYLHDIVQKQDVSTMLKNPNDQITKVRQQNARGRYFSEFQEIDLIGQGGFGKVYKVRHKLDGNIYAIKKAVINFEDINDRKILKQVSLLSKLNHPNIVRYYQSWLQDCSSMAQIIEDMDFTDQQQKIQQLNEVYKAWRHNRSGDINFQSQSQHSYKGSIIQNSGIMFEDNEDSDIAFGDGGENMDLSERSSINQSSAYEKESKESSSVVRGMSVFPFKILYIAMELCNGINLKEFINTRFDDQEQKIKILRGILEGLSYIHQKKIIHRDMKPANIFLTDTNKVKIGDFGLAITQEKSVNMSLGSIDFDPLSDKTKGIGTGFYRAPQQLKSHKYNQKVDIYSLGIIMFELFYQFKTAMQRADNMKDLTLTHELPKDFVAERKGTDILQCIVACLKENPQERPSAAKLLQSFRNKYFSQLVSAIANPKHFQFSELIKQLFDIKNEGVTPLMWRDYFKSYITWKIQKIYQIHKATMFPTLPLVPVQDFHTLNGLRFKINRNQKYLLITNRGVVLQYSSNCLKPWLKYARQDFRRKKLMSLQQQRSSIRRYTFEKIVQWQPAKNNQDLYHHQKMITAFDLAYKLEEGFNAFYLCEVLTVSQAIITTLNLTQRRPPIYMCHSQFYSILADYFKIPKNVFYGALLAIKNGEEFCTLSLQRRVLYFQQKNIPVNFAKRFCQALDEQFENPSQLFAFLQVKDFQQLLKPLQLQIFQLIQIRERYKSLNKLRWKFLFPQSGCNSFFWQLGPLKGLTSIQQITSGQQYCNYHLEMGVDPDMQVVDVSLWCIGQYLEEQMQKIIVQCWKRGLTTRWYDWKLGQKQDTHSRHSIVLKKKNDRVQIMVRHNQAKKGSEQRQSSFINVQQFNWQVLKQAQLAQYSLSFH